MTADQIFRLSEASRAAAISKDGYHSQVVRLCAEVLRLRQAAVSDRNAVLEEAAKEVENYLPGGLDTEYRDGVLFGLSAATRTIRALKTMAAPALNNADAVPQDTADSRRRIALLRKLREIDDLLSAAPAVGAREGKP